MGRVAETPLGTFLAISMLATDSETEEAQQDGIAGVSDISFETSTSVTDSNFVVLST